jgi:hypothetical protein
MEALWGMLGRCEGLARVAAATDAARLPPDDARALTSLLVGIANRFKAHVKVGNQTV